MITYGGQLKMVIEESKVDLRRKDLHCGLEMNLKTIEFVLNLSLLMGILTLVFLCEVATNLTLKFRLGSQVH